MQVKFFPKYSYSGASSRYRTFQYIPFFKNEGVDCKVYPFFDDAHIQNIKKGNRKKSLFSFIKYFLKRVLLVLSLKKNDIVFIEKELIPYFPPIFERYLSLRKIKFILDYDDAIIHNYDLSSNKIIRKILSNKIPYIQSKAEFVVNGSKYLMDLSKQNNKKSIYIPTSLDIEKYKLKENDKNGNFVIGWIGSHSTSKLIMPILDSIEEFCIKHNIKLHLIGFDETLLSDKNKQVIKVIQWKEETEVQEILKFDIGISPSIDTAFARGKCAFKSIQYMACAKPVVTSPVGANAQVVEHGISGYHVNNNEDWFKYLEYLYKNKDIATQMGLKGRERVEKEFTIQKNYKKYIELFNLSNHK